MQDVFVDEVSPGVCRATILARGGPPFADGVVMRLVLSVSGLPEGDYPVQITRTDIFNTALADVPTDTTDVVVRVRAAGDVWSVR